MLQHLKGADAFVFCHKTQESPRSLIEALACGLPLVGYHSEYASHLISEKCGGIFSPMDDIASVVSRWLVCLIRRPLASCRNELLVMALGLQPMVCLDIDRSL